MISLRLTGRLRRQGSPALRLRFLSLWERTEVRVNLSWLIQPSPFPLPKGEGGIVSTLFVPRVNSCSRSKVREKRLPQKSNFGSPPAELGVYL